MGRVRVRSAAARSRTGPAGAGKMAGGRIHVGYDDPFPSTLLNYLRSISSHEPDENVEPSAKRQKRSHEAIGSISVARADLRISRRCATSTDFAGAIARDDVGSSITFSIQSKTEHGLALSISSQSGSPLGRLQAVIMVENEMNDHARKILQAAGRSFSKTDAEGALWATADLFLERRGNIILMKLCFELRWNETSTIFGNMRSNLERARSHPVLAEFFPQDEQELCAAADEENWSPLDFYEAAHVPDRSEPNVLAIEVPDLRATLFPYQQRTLQWLLQREGVTWSQPQHEGLPRLSPHMDVHHQPKSFREVKDLNGKKAYISDLYQLVTTDVAPFGEAEMSFRGGILAEEMGLGKTVEMIALILLHQRGECPEEFPTLDGETLRTTSATLIVTPESLRAQWISELSHHAPYLRVKHYTGCKTMTKEEEIELINELTAHDVVVTTYSLLASELHFAEKPPSRFMRRERQYHRPKSPLVQISWWRVCLDEAQMIESGVSNAANVARIIPRINSWGITGTPVKSNVQDLLGLLRFLRYEPFASHPQIWQALVKRHKPLFRELFSRISLRHTKRMVRDEIALPAQKRFVVTMPFTAVEEQHYQSLFKEMAEACGLDINGGPLTDDWDPEEHEDEMRTWLNRLRQAALHPEVGVQNRRALGHKSGPMRTVDEVLDAMIEQSDNAIRSDQRALLAAKLARGQLLENSPLVKDALAIWEDVRDETTTMVSECRLGLKAAVEEAQAALPQSDAEHIRDDNTEDDLDEFGTAGRIGELRRRLRLALETQHKALFFCANAHFQIKENKEMTVPESEDFRREQKLEEEGYELAKTVRREILQEAHRKATKHMTRLAEDASHQAFAEMPELMPHPFKGLESRLALDRLEELYHALNDQANQLDEWREHVIQLLLKPLVDEEDDIEITGEEFADSADIQDELMVYVHALRAGIADRQDAISGQTNELIKHEAAVAIQNAKNDQGPAPQKLLELLAIRERIKPLPAMGSLRGAIAELRAAQVRLGQKSATERTRVTVEQEILRQQLAKTQAQITAHNKACMQMEQEIDRFTRAMNARLEYYRQLQAVSDSVAPYEGPKNDATMAKLTATEDSLKTKLATAESKHRYLLNLKESGSKSNEPRLCVICQLTFTTGVLTVCGHQFCKECIMLWFKSHHNCPVCKRQLRASNLHDIAIRPQELKVHTEASDPATRERKRSLRSKKTGIYSDFSEEKLAEIKDIELDGPSFTTKVDTLVRHLFWLRESDPGAKSIIFSQYKDFLKVLALAFDRHRIGYTSIDRHRGITRFKEDPGVECFLLHARAHSSGLNLVNASHVFLCEPLLNTALELQAIARVDRIGQQHETTVWLYLVQGTVEESIYNLSIQRRMEHMERRDKGKSKESTPELLDANIEAANTLELEQAALNKLMSRDKSAGEMVDADDLWDCLFGNVVQSQEEQRPDDRVKDPAVIGYLAAEAAEERRRNEAGGRP